MKTGTTMFKIYREAVSLYYTYQGNSWRMSLGIPISEFDKKNKDEIKKVLKTKQDLSEFFPEKWSLAVRIKQRVDADILFHLKSTGRKPSIEELKNLVQVVKSPVESNEDEIFISSNLLKVFEKYATERMKPIESGQLSVHTHKDVLTFRSSIIDFQKKSKREFIIRDINEKWITDLFDFFRESRDKSDGYLTGGNLAKKTLKKRFDTLKNFASWLDKREIYLHTMVKTQTEKLLKERIKTDKVIKYALNDDQLKLIREVELEEGSPLCKARDMFIVVCYTGMRFGDLVTLGKHHIVSVDGIMLLKRSSEKTFGEYEVELHDYVLGIMKKYNYDLNLMGNGKANQYIKQVLAGIDEFCIEISDYKDRYNQVFKLWEIITFHQGRRTFITNLLKKGFSIYEVMERTDHKKIRTLEEYVAKSKENYIKPSKLFGF
jgi:integrase